MPTYQYRCTACGEPHEAVQSFSDASLTVCPTCDGELRKVFSSVGVVFKGSGFYATDNRKSGAKDGSNDGAKEAAASSTTPSKGSSEPATKSSTPPPATAPATTTSTSSD